LRGSGDLDGSPQVGCRGRALVGSEENLQKLKNDINFALRILLISPFMPYTYHYVIGFS